MDSARRSTGSTTRSASYSPAERSSSDSSCGSSDEPGSLRPTTDASKPCSAARSGATTEPEGSTGASSSPCSTRSSKPPDGPTTRPPYKIPTMGEIAAVRGTNGLGVVSTFSGCGGSCLGLEMAGYRILWANEFVTAARDAYRANHPGVYVDDSDIRSVTGQTIRAVVGDGEIDVLEGSPPCAAFSAAGKLERDWGKVKTYSDRAQRVDDLFFEFCRLLGELRPRAFIAENVAGLVRGVAKGYFKLILAALRAKGYRVSARVLDAQWLGVPQHRERVIFIGVRNDLEREPRFPEPLPYRYSLRDAIGDLVDGAVRGANVGRGLTRGADEPISTILTHGRRHTHSERSVITERVWFEGQAIHAEWERLKPGENSERYFQLSRPDPAKPCPTVTQRGGSNPGTASVTHPSEPRKFTIAELRRLCGFPDDFVLEGTYAQNWERLGRAVPPPMMAAIGRTLAEVLHGR